MVPEKKAYTAENCRICNSPFSKEYTLKERMFGFKDEFRYQQCSFCGCLQIAELPENITKYYPPYYYAYAQKIPVLKKLPLMKRLFKSIRLQKKYKKNVYPLTYLKPINTGINDRILDVGCGKGLLICQLFNQGFENVEGVDKFIPHKYDHGHGVKVRKKDLAELKPRFYDLIMMHHVLEHMDQQKDALTDCRNLLKDDGCLMIRIPLIGEAWKLYQEDWVQLDAPRHFFLHSLKSMQILAESSGFEIRHTVFDSTGFQFWGSELYKKDIPLFSEKDDFKLIDAEKMFDLDELKAYAHEAEQLNIHCKGDSAAFYLYKK
ncbi:MAG: class I SAM-dependent methyltransferase [Mucilaginibacter sp.]|uniref:class I SAM-dependent methyltransferase n=1 Tax=Mucilaginibacter sp. TaxID=1882438 RepID=UPI0034E56070